MGLSTGYSSCFYSTVPYDRSVCLVGLGYLMWGSFSFDDSKKKDVSRAPNRTWKAGGDVSRERLFCEGRDWYGARNGCVMEG